MTRTSNLIGKLLCLYCLCFSISGLYAQTIYIDAKHGNDLNPGTEVLPIKTLKKAAEKINQSVGETSTELILTEGIYLLDSAIIFKPAIEYSTTNRLVIRAKVLPDDPNWKPSSMPSVLPLLLDKKKDPDGEWANGIQIATSHVTIAGLKIMGSPVHEYIAENKIIRSYPIVREGADLKDLLISQCLFIGDEQILPLHLGIYAAGNEVVVDHCVFYNCKVGVLFVNYGEKETTGNAVTNSLFVNSYGAAVWIMNTAIDYLFKGNSIVNSNYAIIKESGNSKKYTIQNSLLANNKEIVGIGSGALLNFSPLNLESLQIGKNVKITGSEKEIILDQSKREYFHILNEEINKDYIGGLFFRKK